MFESFGLASINAITLAAVAFQKYSKYFLCFCSSHIGVLDDAAIIHRFFLGSFLLNMVFLQSAALPQVAIG